MTLHLRLWKDGDRVNATEHPFEQDVVGIGRDPTNALQLARPNVSKSHASIEQRHDGLYLTDLKSRNGTYVNGVRIPSEDPHPLSPGDKVRVCEFIVEVVAWDRPAASPVVSPEVPALQEVPPAQEVPVAEEEPVSPGREEVVPPPVAVDSRIAEENAQRLAAAEEECERLKTENVVLGQKLAEVSAMPPPVAVDSRIAEENAQRLAATEQECERLKAENAALGQKLAEVSAIPPPVAVDSRIAEENAQRLAAAEKECERLKAELAALGQKLAAVPETPPRVQQVDESTALARLKAVLEAVLQPVLKIMRGRILFRSEFTGATMFQDREMEAVSKQKPEEWIRFFLDAELSEEKARDRLELLSLETREMIPHVIGLLDGYRKSVDVGMKNMLQQMSPSRVREELFKKPLKVGPLSIPYRFLPLIADRIAWKAIEQRHRELQEEDRGILEQRFFRPGFIQGYISCISSAKHEPLPSRPKTSTSTKAKP